VFAADIALIIVLVGFGGLGLWLGRQYLARVGRVVPRPEGELGAGASAAAGAKRPLGNTTRSSGRIGTIEIREGDEGDLKLDDLDGGEDGEDGEDGGVDREALYVQVEAALAQARLRPELEVQAAVLLTEGLESVELVVPPAASNPATAWLMNQGPVQFGLMPNPGAVARIRGWLVAVMKWKTDEARKVALDSGLELLRRSLEWRRAEALHEALIAAIGALGEEPELAALDLLLLERSLDDDEKKALVAAKREIRARSRARRGRLAFAADGGHLAMAPDPAGEEGEEGEEGDVRDVRDVRDLDRDGDAKPD